MIREARALGVSLALHGAVLTGVFCVCGGAGPGAAEHPRVIDLRLLEPEIARTAAPTAAPAAPAAPRPRLARPRPPAPPPPTEPTVHPVAIPSPSLAPAPEQVAESPAPVQALSPPPPVPSEDLDAAPAPVVAAVATPVPADGGGERHKGRGRVAGTADFAAATSAAPAEGSDFAGNAESGDAAPDGVASAVQGGPPGDRGGRLPRDLAALREIVQRSLVYPSLARRMGWEGKVTLSFIVCRDGRAREVVVVESSGRDLLDRHAVESVQRISGLPASTTEAKVIVPVVYRLQ